MKRLRDSQLKLLWTARIDYSQGSRVEPHMHSDYDQLLVVLSGQGQAVIGGQSCEAKEGAAFLFLKGVSHSFRFTSSAITLDYKFQLLDGQLRDCLEEAEPSCLCGGTHLAELKRWHKMSLHQMRNPKAHHPLGIESGLKGTLVTMLLGEQAGWSDSYAALPAAGDDEPIVRYVKTHFSDKITLDMLARQFGFNPNYLIKRFSDKTGMTPIQYLQEIRLDKAKEYLEFTSLPISEVAEKVGWTQEYFSKIVKKRLGQSPSQYRESLMSAVGKDIILDEDFANVWRIVP
ncbi:AraC family transcriptional regulator [Paenibacillus doosanensis]|uniref:AraC family transcriptional regulator n=1 Tax=Paenibacillus doosanensis TaxID=1229154 RepID=UPI0021806F5A|nr:AraC family transcriptional regulator [Paenibacillus doosanensis]MCS7458807.1 AraC family transcriptional regulator [Paenibacillus doosanensis]